MEIGKTPLRITIEPAQEVAALTEKLIQTPETIKGTPKDMENELKNIFYELCEMFHKIGGNAELKSKIAMDIMQFYRQRW